MEQATRNDMNPPANLAAGARQSEAARPARERARELVRELTQLLVALGAAGYEASVNGYEVAVEKEPVSAGPSELERRRQAAAQWYSLIRG